MARDETIRSLTARLEAIRLPDGTGRTSAQVTDGTIDVALARIQAVTELLRAPGAGDEVSRLAARLLLDDLAVVSAHFRARANDLGIVLSDALPAAVDPSPSGSSPSAS